MARKSNRKQRAPQMRSLEELLRTRGAAVYGQVCWSVANRDTGKRRAGDTLTLAGLDEEGGQTDETFRLTPKSIENIERCLGMRTCEEGVALFTEAREAAPWGECAQGHPGAALESMLYGIQPSEPCPNCGEVPRFSDTAMSLNFHSGAPVKGVDGQGYAICPQCGDESLERRGSSLMEWGWKIVCMNCGWEMKQAESLDIGQYCELMEDIKSRVEAIDQLMGMPGITIRTRVESISLQLRMLLELVVFSSLVSNKDVWKKSQKELQSSQDIGKKLRELARIHPNFYPKPVELKGSSAGEEPADRTEGFLSEDKLIKVYGRLGNILHAENPMGRETDYRYFIEAVPDWISQVNNLLECHKVHLYHHPEEFYLVKMFGDVDGELMCIPFSTTAKGETKCAWPDCVSSSARRYCEYLQGSWRECPLPELEPDQTQGKRIADEFDDPAEKN